MFLHNGQRLNLDQPFTIEDTNYPPNWLRESTPEMREALGIVEITWGPRPDDRFYWVQENMDGTYTTIPKDLEPTKNVFLNQIAQTAYSLLNTTDYMDFRHLADSTYTPPANWVTYRAAVRAYIATAKAAINAATDIPSLITAVSGLQWPAAPDTTV